MKWWELTVCATFNAAVGNWLQLFKELNCTNAIGTLSMFQCSAIAMNMDWLDIINIAPMDI